MSALTREGFTRRWGGNASRAGNMCSWLWWGRTFLSAQVSQPNDHHTGIGAITGQWHGLAGARSHGQDARATDALSHTPVRVDQADGLVGRSAGGVGGARRDVDGTAGPNIDDLLPDGDLTNAGDHI